GLTWALKTIGKETFATLGPYDLEYAKAIDPGVKLPESITTNLEGKFIIPVLGFKKS
ncbi:MAG: hypothetical protein GY729_02660, partial [Desulfobacteraceae bacterium]|nr:hypothetical protein [Desulfobacteraceae bacterium]